MSKDPLLKGQGAKFRAVLLNASFRPRVPKPYFPAPGSFKTGQGRV